MSDLSPNLLKGEYLVVQNTAMYTQLTNHTQPVKVVVARHPHRRPCEPGYAISSVFVRSQRIAVEIDLYRHPDAPDLFEFAYEGQFYTLRVDERSAQIQPL